MRQMHTMNAAAGPAGGMKGPEPQKPYAQERVELEITPIDTVVSHAEYRLLALPLPVLKQHAE